MFYSNLISLLLLPLLAILVSLLIGTWFSWLFWLLWFLWPFCLFPSSFPFWQITVVRPPILPISMSSSWQSWWFGIGFSPPFWLLSSSFWKKMGKNYLQCNMYLLLVRKSYSNCNLQEIKKTALLQKKPAEKLLIFFTLR